MARRTRKCIPPRTASGENAVSSPPAPKTYPALVLPELKLDAASIHRLDLSKYFNSDILSDITIHAGSSPCIFHAHQLILWDHTSFFSDAINSGFAESESRVVTLQDDPMVVWAFLKWCYEGDVVGEVSGVYQSDPPLDAALLFLRLYFLAGMLMVPELLVFCVRKLEKLITFNDLYCSIDFAALIPEALENTADNEDPLRVMLGKKAVEGYTTLTCDNRYLAMLKAHPEFMETIFYTGLRFCVSNLAEMGDAVKEYSQKSQKSQYFLSFPLGQRQLTRLNLKKM